jgi:peptidyl-tRNA hydrolase, PTH1 family
MYVLACLGNPGKKHTMNRHNVGFMLGEFFIRKYNMTISSSSFRAISGKVTIQMKESLLLMPQDYMNKSGTAVRMALDFFKVPPDHLVVIHDDIELPFGIIRKKFGGGHKGHNGIRSIIQEIGTPDFYRVRFGVGRPENQEIAVADHVLSNFTKEELIKIQELASEVENMLSSIIAPEP